MEYHGQNGEVFIDIWNYRATLAREQWDGNTGHVNYCANGDELEDEILAEIDRQDGAINMSGRMYCPPALAAKAIF